jgi:hypothetical protein
VTQRIKGPIPAILSEIHLGKPSIIAVPGSQSSTYTSGTRALDSTQVMVNNPNHIQSYKSRLMEKDKSQ